MTKLTFTHQIIRGSELNGDSPLPMLGTLHKRKLLQSQLPPGDSLLVDYGSVHCLYPYTQQDRYNRELTNLQAEVAILENEHLRATFLTGYGGRLWQLWDKDEQRDLVYVNDLLRPANLALRNAWFSGGIEFNCGIIGHHPFTCSPMFVAAYDVDGSPVLRLYQWERIRNIAYQIDFYLPPGSHFLYARTRLHNPNPETVPMYWWSNTAVPEDSHGRVAVPAKEAYFNEEGMISRGAAPVGEGGDFSYPVRTSGSKDYFYYLPENSRKYEGYFTADGWGLIQTSTSQLQGRKLFVWGQQEGSRTWQRFLTNNAGPYVEIQAGLGRTQYGCVAMPAGGVWEFAECYGSLRITPEAQRAEYDSFIGAVEEALEAALPQGSLIEWLENSRREMGESFRKIQSQGSGDASLEVFLRKQLGLPELAPWLDFGQPEAGHEDFLHLLAYGYLPHHAQEYLPKVFVHGQHWQHLLQTAVEGADRANWLTWYHLGLVTYASGQSDALREALIALQHAADLCSNGAVLYAMAVVLSEIGEKSAAVPCLMKCCRLYKGDLSVAKECLRLLALLGAFREMLLLYQDLPETVQSDGRVEFLRLAALVYLDRGQEAYLRLADPSFVIADIREGELSLSDLWEEIGRQNGSFKAVLPAHLNFKAK
ncbi:MAG: DUF5107 domain-containing protein [Symbiobacteriaceae bacterium]|nr:DUF5107 domain-containing protein [Symbiobacteriaceae bacterium]